MAERTPVRRPSLSRVPDDIDQSTQRFLRTVKERADIDDGAHNDDDERVSWGELKRRMVAAGIVNADSLEP